MQVLDGSTTRLLLRRTLTTPHRWESVSLDLSEYAGREIALSLSLSAAEDGRLGFWGSPAVRSRGRQSAQVTTGSETPQGVILILADTLRSDHLNFHGYGRETAPFLTELASKGAFFKNNIVQATWTKVSVPSIITSLYPTSHRVIDFTDRLPAAAHDAGRGVSRSRLCHGRLLLGNLHWKVYESAPGLRRTSRIGIDVTGQAQ